MNPTAPKSHPPGEHDRCPRCSGAEIYASGPSHGFDEYRCTSCGARWDVVHMITVASPTILGGDARAVPSPPGIPTDVDVPMGFIYRPDDKT